MTLSFTGAGVASAASGASPQAVTTATAFAVGDYLVALIAYDNSGGGGADPMTGTITVTPASGSLGASVSAQTGLNDPGSGSAGLAVRCVAFPVTGAIASSTSCNVAWSGTLVVRAVVFGKVTGGGTVGYRTNSGATGTNATPATTAALTTPSVDPGEMVLCWVGVENGATPVGDSDTTNGSWGSLYGTFSGSGVAGMAAWMQAKAVTATGTQTWNLTTSPTLTVDWTLGCLIFTESPLITQAAYRFYDQGTESGSTALQAQNTPHTGDLTSGDGLGQVRIRLQETVGAVVPATDDFSLQWEKNASGTWSELRTTVTNLVPNPSIEVNTTGWAASLNCTIARDGTKGGAVAASGSWALAPTATAAGNYSFLSASPYIPVSPSTEYRASGWVWSTPSQTIILSVAYYTSGLVFISSSTNVVGGGLNSWQRMNTTVTTPSNAAALRFSWSATAVAGGEKFWLDAVMLTQGPTLHAYFDGTTAGASWSGTAHDSASILVVPGTGVIPYNDPSLTDAAATTNRLTGGTGSFVAGKVSEDGVADNVGWTASNYTELLFSVQFVRTDFVDGDVVRFRVVRNGSTTGMTYSQTPTVTLTIGAANVTGVATGTISLSGDAAGVGATPGTDVTGAATGSLFVAGTATGTRDTPGTATGSISLAGAATGTVDHPTTTGTATGTLTLSGAASGQKTVTATATGSLTLAGAAIGSRNTDGVATGSITLTGTATGTVAAGGTAVTGTATGSLSLAGTATGVRGTPATASGNIQIVGVATGRRGTNGTLTGSITLTGTASGARAVTATATGQITLGGTALGQVEGNAVGHATGTITLTGVATGLDSTPTTGAATGTITIVGHAGGTRGTPATATGTIAVVGVAAGAVSHNLTGTASGTITIVGTATGIGPFPPIIGQWNGETTVALQWGAEPVVEWMMV